MRSTVSCRAATAPARSATVARAGTGGAARRSRAGSTDRIAPVVAVTARTRARTRPGRPCRRRSIAGSPGGSEGDLEGLDVSLAGDRLAGGLGRERGENLGGVVALVLDGGVDVDHVAGVDHGVGEVQADPEGLAGADAGAGDAV